MHQKLPLLAARSLLAFPPKHEVTQREPDRARGCVAYKHAEVDLVALDDTLNALADVDPGKSRVVELRHFGGLSVEQKGVVMKTSRATVIR